MEVTNETEIEAGTKTGIDTVAADEKPLEEVKEKVTEETKEEVKNELLIQFSVEVPKETIDIAFDEALVKYAHEIKLPGFRQGKIPLEVMRERFKDAIKDEVVEKALQKAVFDKIDKDKIKIASQPSIEKMDFDEGSNLKAEVAVEIFPTVELPELETIVAEIPASELIIPEYDEEKQIDMLLEGNKKQSPVMGRGIQENDYVSLKYQAKILQTKKMTPQKQTYFLVNEKDEFEIMDLYKDILGKSKDDHFTVVRTYPEDYKKKQWAGKEIEFFITIINIMEMVKPEFNEAFLKSIGMEDEATFKTKWKEEYENYHRNAIEEKKINYILNQLVTSISFPVPRAMVEEEAEHIFSHYQQQYHFSDDMRNPVIMEPMKKEAEKSIRLSLIMDAIKKKFELDIKSDELENEYKKVSEANKIPLAEVRKYFMGKEQSLQLKERLMKAKVYGLLKEKVKVSEIEASPLPETNEEKK